MANVLSDDTRQQVDALCRLGWTLRRIQRETGVRREAASNYLHAAELAIRGHGGAPKTGLFRQGDHRSRLKADHNYGDGPMVRYAASGRHKDSNSKYSTSVHERPKSPVSADHKWPLLRSSPRSRVAREVHINVGKDDWNQPGDLGSLDHSFPR